MQLSRGFSLVEMTVVLVIVALLLGSAIFTLSAQEEQRALAETRRRLDAASDAVIGFAIANRRLPCPAAGTNGTESLASGTAATGGPCSSNFGGFLPAVSLGFQPVDAQGFAVDAWGNRIRYAVARAWTGCTPTPVAGTTVFTSKDNLKAYGVSCRPNDLLICQSSSGTSPGASPPSCGTAQAVTNQESVMFVLHSSGKNGTLANGADELANTNGDAIFVSREHGSAETTTGIYDDILLWVPAGVVYSKLIAAGVLP